MSNKTIVFALITLVITSLLTNTFYSRALTSHDKIDFHTSSLKHHKPIHIEGNKGFTAENGVIGGDGTPENPYIISNWFISPFYGNGIFVSNTNVYFIIENCFISGKKVLTRIDFSSTGIFFSNVTNGRIINCTCINCGFGFLLVSSSNNTVENCCCENSSFGISINGCPYGYTTSSNNNIIRNCTFSCCEDGVYFCCLPGSSNNLIDNCIILNNKRGVVLDHCIHYTLIVNCNISNNEVGLSIISASSHNYISNNVFWKNKEHARDNCKNIWDNGPVFGGNYWEGHNSSEPYDIPGAGENKDFYPLDREPKQKPFISFFYSSSYLVLVGQEVCFDAVTSYTPADNVHYKWDFGDETTASGCKVKHVYSKEGVYNVTLKVANQTVNDSFTQSIHVFKLTPAVIHVPEDVKSVQEAIENAKPGYLIHVENGTYHECILVNKPYLTLTGSGYETIIDGEEQGDVVYITAPSVTIMNFTIRNSSSGGAGVQLGKPDYVLDAFGCFIENNHISGNNIGVNMSETERNTLKGNVITGNTIGVYSTRSYSNTFSSNRVFLNNIGFSLEYGSNWNKIRGNAVTSNVVGVGLQWSHYNIITRNNVVSNEIGFNLTNAISPKINYNNIYSNQIYGAFFTGMLPDMKHNWWGSKLGPSWLIPLFGDRVYMGGNSFLRLRGVGVRTICFPWETKPV
ncbi:MAG TPA: PKD domain-containing protein [Thermoplasmatales archaeon]|nr:PKD domain-containing protein [Thermoplasmatales archaeon]